MNKQLVDAYLKQDSWKIILGAILISLFGIMAISNATCHLSTSYLFVLRQSIWCITGIVFFFILNLSCSWKNIKKNLYGGALIVWLSLWAVLLVGIKLNGQYVMTGWFCFGDIFIQPAEFAKPFFVFLCMQVCRYVQEKYTPMKAVCFSWLFFFIWILPILLQPDLGCILIHFFIFGMSYWLNNGKIWPFIKLLLPLGLLNGIGVFFFFPHFINRIEGFLFTQSLSEGSGWHIIQFQNSLANGGWWGEACLPDCWHNAYLPLGYSDSIFVTIAETCGFFVTTVLLLLPIFWSYYCWKKYQENSEKPEYFLFWGWGSYLSFQAIIHISVNLGMMPTTGLTYPLISYGGSSMITTWLTLALMIIALKKDTKF